MKEKIDELEKLYSEINELTPEKMEMLVSESIKTFEQILGQMNSGSEEEKKEAVKAAERLRENLEKQAQKAVDKLKISTDELEAFASNPDNFSEEEWEALQRAKGDLESYQTDVVKRGVTAEDLQKESQAKSKKKKQKPLWVAG